MSTETTYGLFGTGHWVQDLCQIFFQALLYKGKNSGKQHMLDACLTPLLRSFRFYYLQFLLCRFLTGDATKTLVTSCILSRLDYLNCLLMTWVHLILSSKRSRKFRTLLQDLFSWHPVTTTQHVSWKNCTGFPFQNVLSIKSLVCVSMLYHSSAVWESRWPSWAVRPNKPSGFHGRKDLLNHASASVTACP